MLDANTHRDVFRLHHESCRPCSDLFAFARERGDLQALGAWREQLAAHLANEAERREYDRLVREWLTGSRGGEAWSPERVAP